MVIHTHAVDHCGRVRDQPRYCWMIPFDTGVAFRVHRLLFSSRLTLHVLHGAFGDPVRLMIPHWCLLRDHLKIQFNMILPWRDWGFWINVKKNISAKFAQDVIFSMCAELPKDVKKRKINP